MSDSCTYNVQATWTGSFIAAFFSQESAQKYIDNCVEDGEGRWLKRHFKIVQIPLKESREENEFGRVPNWIS